MSAQELLVEREEEVFEASSPGRLSDAFALLYANKIGFVGAILTVFVLAVGAVGSVLLVTPSLHHLYLDQNLSEALLPPGSEGHLLGTDQYGRDLLWRTVAGTGISLLVGVLTTACTLVLGLFFGLISGYYGGGSDTVIRGLIDLTWGFPLLLVAVVYAGIFGPGLRPVILALGTVIWAGFARVVRAQAKTLKEREFIEAARALGTSGPKIMIRHLIPNIFATLLVMASYYVAIAVIAEAGFSFIGLGAQPPTPSLGQMIADGANYWSVSIWLAIVPGTMIVLIVLALNLFGDGLRDIFDPRMRES
jgi:peptide/nickel transport system permease protein